MAKDMDIFDYLGQKLEVGGYVVWSAANDMSLSIYIILDLMPAAWPNPMVSVQLVEGTDYLDHRELRATHVLAVDPKLVMMKILGASK